ncbi:MAG: tRNA adenosine(34) deaminase TadA, partial [Clostridia bacterium]|nr:tRNA adenosine(34) deaminase TadA [Clostridia bacterium]
QDERYMREALAEAGIAREMDEVPVGAVIVYRGERIIGRGHNEKETGKNALYHAELIAIDRACRELGGWRLPESTLYVTLEPCPMCAGAIVNARIGRVVIGTADPRTGAFGGITDLNALPLNHKPEIVSGVLGEECAELLRSYFREKREKAKTEKSASDLL